MNLAQRIKNLKKMMNAGVPKGISKSRLWEAVKQGGLDSYVLSKPGYQKKLLQDEQRWLTSTKELVNMAEGQGSRWKEKALDNQYREYIGDVLAEIKGSRLQTDIKEEIFDTSGLDFEGLPYIQSHPGLAENIRQDVEKWGQSVRKEIGEQNPFKEEETFVNDLNLRSAEDIERAMSSIKEKYEGIAGDASVDFSFFEKEFQRANEQQGEEDKNARKEAVSRRLIDDMKAELERRKNIWMVRVIDEMRQKFLKDLYEKIEKFKKIEKTLSAFTQDTGILWDMANAEFREGGFELLSKYADLLSRDESLQELAEVLGKHSRAQIAYEKELRSKIVVQTEWVPHFASKGQIVGLCLSNDISSVLPSELVLMKNPNTRKLFEFKFAQKQLLSFKYENSFPEKTERSETEEIEVSKEKEEPKGPIIICVDTSGSMSGEPERIAKTVAFALSKLAIEEHRKCYLISFSTGIETLDLADIQSGNALKNLVQFLGMSFWGGTDAMPALKHALSMLKSNDYRNADVLMISDFVMGGLDDEIEHKILAEKRKKTDFYSLVIGCSGNENAIRCFNHNWSYDIYNPDASRKLVRQLRQIKNARAEHAGEK